MRKLVFTLIAFMSLTTVRINAAATQMDPGLIAAIGIQTATLKEQYEKRSDHHTKIEIAQAAIAVAMDNVHRVEEKVLEYMANASGVMQNLNQLKKITELAFVDIPDNLVKLGEKIPSNIKGTAITALVSKTVTSTTMDIVSLADIVQRLVSSNYSFKDSKDSKNINLLSAAERYSILQDVLYKLEDINFRIYMMRFYIQTFDWTDLWRGLDRQSWCRVMSGQAIAERLIREWNSVKG